MKKKCIGKLSIILLVAALFCPANIFAESVSYNETNEMISTSVSENEIETEGVASVDFETTVDGVVFTLDTDGMLTISGESTTGKMPHLENEDEIAPKVKSIVLTVKGITEVQNAFSGYTNATRFDVSNFDASTVTSLNDMFHGMKSLTGIDLSQLDVKHIRKFGALFCGCESLTSVVLPTTSDKTIYLDDMFWGCKSLKSIDLSPLSASSIGSTKYMFYSCESLEKIDLSCLNGENVAYVTYMFAGDTNLKEIVWGDFAPQKIRHCNAMFKNCSSLTSIDLSGWAKSETVKFARMKEMCSGCKNLQSIDLSSFYFTDLYDATSAFAGCEKLQTVKLGSIDVQDEYLKSDSLYDGAYSMESFKNIFADCKNLSSVTIQEYRTDKKTLIGPFYFEEGKTKWKIGKTELSEKNAAKYVSTDGNSNGWYAVLTPGSKNISLTKVKADGTQVKPNPVTDEKVKLSYDVNGGNKLDKNSISLDKNTALGKLPQAARKGYTLKGWYTEKTGGTKVSADTKLSRNTTIYAQWKKVTVKKAAISSLIKRKQTLLVKWRKVSGANGYEIRYSKKKSMKNAKKIAKKSTVRSCNIKGLAKNTKYYVQVRAYKKDSMGKKVYGSWSNVRNKKM